ncbi:MAG TPA: c-type cytochrome [Thiobacillaceae bacterium]|nr:c-type cytochrome [Thiobacillaceae bacterium]
MKPLHQSSTRHHSPLTFAQALLLVLGSACSISAAAGGDAKAGADKAMFCATCHGLDGNATQAGVPRLAGQPETRFMSRIKRYRAGARAQHPMMAVLTQGLTAQDLADLGAYYAAQKPAPAPGRGKE